MAALLLFVFRGSGAAWGSLVMHEGRAAAAGAAIFCAWLLVVSTDDGRGCWEVGALVGAGSAALVGTSLGEWIAPTLLFWVCLSAATAVAATKVERPGWTPLVVAVSDACVVGGLLGWALQQGTWRLPEEVHGWAFVVVVAGLVLRAGVVPRIGAWDLATAGTVGLIPLLVGSVFVLVPTVSGGDEVAVALPLLVAGTTAALWCALRSPQIVLGAGWLVATMLALVFVEPASLGKAAPAAALAATAVLVWPWTGGRAGPERGLLLALVPLTVGFGPIVGGAVASFERASTAPTVLEAAPWAAFAALLPAALAVGVTMGAAVARRVEPETFRPLAVLATWAVASLGLVLGLTGGAELSLDLRPELRLYLVAVLCAGAAARFGPRQAVRSDVVLDPTPPLGLLVLPTSATKLAHQAAAGLIAAAFVAALWFTYVGLRAGFL